MTFIRSLLRPTLSGLALSVMTFAGAHGAESSVTYKCPGNHYSNTMSAREAKDKGCTVLDNAPVTVIQGIKPRPAASAASGSGAARIDPNEQRSRDSDARRILEGELRREEDRLAAMKAEFNNGEPARQGEERNNQKYLDRVADMKAAIARKESDLGAIRRELAKLPQ